MPQNFYDVVWIFIIYAFLGWCTEVAYAALEHGKFVNRGFLNGPYCPIYGCGILIVVCILTPIKNNVFVLFLGSFLLTSVLEFITGFVMEKIFHNKWWDYSNQHFNIMGYVCLKFSIIWGFACTFVILIVHPVIYGLIHIIPKIIGIVLISVIMACFTADLIVTVSTIVKFNKRLKLMDEIAGRLKQISDGIGENVYEGVVGALEKKEEIQEKSADLLDQFEDRRLKEKEELTKKYNELLNRRNRITTRLIKAFPDMKSMYNNEILDRLKENLRQNIKKNQVKKEFSDDKNN